MQNPCASRIQMTLNNEQGWRNPGGFPTCKSIKTILILASKNKYYI